MNLEFTRNSKMNWLKKNWFKVPTFVILQKFGLAVLMTALILYVADPRFSDAPFVEYLVSPAFLWTLLWVVVVYKFGVYFKRKDEED